MSVPSKRLAGSILALSLFLVACGGDGDDPGATTDTTGDQAAPTTEEQQPTTGDGAAEADVRTGEVAPIEGAPEGYDDVSGTATITRGEPGTTVTLEMEGLEPDTTYLAHLHEGACADGAGPHYRHDPAGGAEPPNEMHIHFDSTADGTGAVTVEDEVTADERAVSVAIHEAGGQMFACADFGERS